MALLTTNSWLFGALFGKSSFYKSQSIQLGMKGPVYIDTEKPYDLYHSIPQLRTIIGKKKSMFANVVPILKDKNGNVINNARSDEFYKLIYSPNVTQGLNAFLENQLEQLDVYGNQFTYKNKPSTLTSFPVALWNISPRYMQPVVTGKVFEQVDINEIIKNYKYIEDSSVKTYGTNEIMYVKHTDLDNPIVGCSPLKYLKHPLSNIEGAYKFRNTIINEKGALGILSNNSKDSMGGVPMKTGEKERIEKQHRTSYGNNDDQMKMLITEASLTWTPMSYPTKDLLLFEEVEADTSILIDHFGMNINLFGSKGATFENVKESIKQVYSDTIQPYADSYFQQLTSFLNIELIFGKGAFIEPSYEHIKILQEDKNESADLFKMHVESITQLVINGIISIDQGKKLLTDISGIKL